MSSNVRFVRVTNNKARRRGTSTYPRLTNGNGAYPGAPALVQDAAFPMDNFLLNGRTGTVYVWPVSAGPNSGNDVLVEMDIGSVQAITAGGALGMLVGAGSGFPVTVSVEYLPNTAVYSTSGWVTAVASIPTAARDAGSIIAPLNGRYWRFRFINASFGNGFSAASGVLASAITDLGFLYSGADETRIRPRTLVESYSRAVTLTYVGTEYRRWSLRYDNNDAALRATFDGLYGDPEPFVFITPDDAWQECIFETEDFTRSHIWSPPDRYALTPLIRSLP